VERCARVRQSEAPTWTSGSTLGARPGGRDTPCSRRVTSHSGDRTFVAWEWHRMTLRLRASRELLRKRKKPALHPAGSRLRPRRFAGVIREPPAEQCERFASGDSEHPRSAKIATSNSRLICSGLFDRTGGSPSRAERGRQSSRRAARAVVAFAGCRSRASTCLNRYRQRAASTMALDGRGRPGGRARVASQAGADAAGRAR
jgi:hypothetical protein